MVNKLGTIFFVLYFMSHDSYDGFAAFYVVFEPHSYLDTAWNYYIDPRAKFDDPKPFTCFNNMTFPEVADNSPGNQPRDLLENHPARVILDTDDSLFVNVGSGTFVSIDKRAFLIAKIADTSGNGYTIDMDIEYGQKNTHPCCLPLDKLALRLFLDIYDPTISGGKDQSRISGDTPFRIAKEPKAKKGQNTSDNRNRFEMKMRGC
jgi:hypothetical protein